MGLFRISRELQFGVCIFGKPHASPHTVREGEYFYRRSKEVGKAIVNKESMAFHVWVLDRNKEESSFFLLDSAIVPRCESFLFDLLTLFNWGCCLLFFLHFSPFYQDFSLKALLIKSGFPISVAFLPICARKCLSSCKCTVSVGLTLEGKCTDWKPIGVTSE